jgi:DNA (cytosine-5)-methyltransferase 1
MRRNGSRNGSGSQGPTFIDLFSGCGGLSLGFKHAGFEPLIGVEILADAATTYERNIGAKAYQGPVEEFVACLREAPKTLGRVDVVIGGPPCQGFSPLGRMSRKGERTRCQEEQNELWRYFVEVVKIVKPRAFVMENVPEFLRSPELELYLDAIGELGYDLAREVLDASAFGVAQRRRRLFFIGLKVGAAMLPADAGERSTVRDAIGHLPLEPDGLNWHLPRQPRPLSLARYKEIPPGGNRFDLMRKRPDLAPPCWLRKPSGTTDVFGRLEWDKPSATIRTEFFKPEKGRYLHPEADRPITHREAACLQSFPTDFEFVGSRTSVARQIGEAVPPHLAEVVANHLLKQI